MVSALVMINVESGSDHEVQEALKKISNVKEIFLVYGVCDIVVKVEVESMTMLQDAVIKKIRALEKVKTTLTMIVYE